MDGPTATMGLAPSPYPGLRSFRRDEADIFFGREEQVDRLLVKLQSQRFLAVVGASGCGKSSLVRAGLLPALDAGLLASAGVRWHIAELRPEDRPLENFVNALLNCGVLGDQWPDGESSQCLLRAALNRGPLGLVEVLRDIHLPPRMCLLILVDQFEEIFRYCERGDSNAALLFVNLLFASAAAPDVPIYVALTMRSDFIGDCAIFPGLPEALNDCQFLTPRLTREQCRAAIEGPAAAFGAEVEPSLVNHILNDIGTDPDQLPLMQHSLMRLWFAAAEPQPSAESNGRELRHADYESIGGLTHALSNHADSVYLQLPTDSDRRIAAIMFRCLTERGSGKRDTRRPQPVVAIARVAGVEPSDIIRVAEAFRQPGCNFLVPQCTAPLQFESVLDLTHESLIRKWDRLVQWVTAESESAAMYGRIRDTAELWVARRAALWGAPDLDNALRWKEEEQPCHAWSERYGSGLELVEQFLNESHVARETSQRREQEQRDRELRMARELAAANQERAEEAEARRIGQTRAAQRFRLVAAVAVVFALLAAGLSAVSVTNYVRKKVALRQSEIDKQQAEIDKQQAEVAERKAVDATREAEANRNEAIVQKSRADDEARKANENADRQKKAKEEAVIARDQADAFRKVAEAESKKNENLLAKVEESKRREAERETELEQNANAN